MENRLHKLFKATRQLWVCARAATAIEYGLMAAGVALIILAAVNNLGGSLSTSFNSIAEALPASSGGIPVNQDDNEDGGGLGDGHDDGGMGDGGGL